MQKRLLAALLTICFVISLMPTIALAEEDVLSSTDQYTDVSLEDAVAYLDGSGTEDDPFQIWNADDLYYVNYIEYWRDTSDADTVYYYQQMQDLDLSDAAQFDRDTGYITANFGGVYDGGGYAIHGMTKSLFYFTLGDYIGDEDGTVFTDYVSGDSHAEPFSAIVRNLVIADPQITQTVATDVIEQMGAIAAYAVNTTFYNIQVEGGQINGISGAAAIAGRAGSVVIDSCSSDTDIYTSMHRAAGIVSNLRIVDEKKGATATSLVTNCTFSGTISGNLDGERGSAGIVGAVYMDGESTLCGGAGLPLYVTDCTFSGEIAGTVTSGSGNFGGILGTSYLGPGLYLKDNVVTGSIQDITVDSEATAANVGGIVGKMLNYSLLDSGISLVMENNDASQAVLPDTDPENNLYVGTQLGCLNDPNRTITGAVSISTAEGLGEYGNLQGAQLAGEVGDLVLPASSGSVQLYILEGATVNSVTADADTGLNIYNDGTLGNVTNTKSINIYANTGILGDVTAQNGTVTVGYSNKTAETAGSQVGNEGGTIGNITGTSVTVHRNSGTIASLTATTGAVAIGQGSTTTTGVADYNINSGSIGSVTAATSVSIQGGQVEGGSVAVGEGQSIQAGTSVAIGSNAVLNGVALVNRNDIGDVQAETTVTLYNGEGVSMGNIDATGNVTIYANAAGSTIGTVTSSAGYITIGADNKTEDNNGDGAYVGNEGTIGDLTAYTGVSVKRNTGTVGNLTSTTSSVTVGQANAAYVDYNTNAGTIGAVDAATSAAIYGTSNTGRVAAEDGQSIQAGTSVAIGATTYPNENTVGPVNAGTTVAIYGGEQSSVGNVMAEASVAIGSTTVPSQGIVGTVGAGTTVTIYGGEQGAVGNVTADTSVTIGSTTAPNYSTVGTVTAPTVSGYTVGVVGTVNATTNKLVKADDTVGTGVITVAGSVTLAADKNGTITADGKTYAAGSKLVLTKEGTVTFGGDYPVQLSSIESNGKLTLLDAGGKAEIGAINTVGDMILGNATVFAGTITGDVTATGSLTVGTSSVYFTGTIGGSLNITGNITIYNSGTIGTENGNHAISTATGTISITNGKSGSTPITGTIYSDVVNNSAANTTSITNNGTPMAGAICQSGTGNLTLSGTGTASQYTGPISVGRALTIGNNIGSNLEENAILADFTGENGTISVANHSFYLKVTGSGLTSLSVASTASTAGKNTVDLSGLDTSVNVAKAVGNENATTVILPDGATPPSSMGTLIDSTVDTTVEGDTYATGSVTVSDGVSLSADGTLILTASSATITNNGTIGEIWHLGTGTLSIHNIGENATIGNVTSAGTINVGASEKTKENANTAVGNEGTIGNMIAAVNVNVYRNTGIIDNIIAETGTVTIGQGNNTKTGVADYNVNSGSIGSVLACTSVSIQGGQMEGGSVANGEGQSIQAGTTVTIGSNTVLDGAALVNQNDIGDVQAGTTVTIYNGEGVSMGNIEATGNVAINANAVGSTIGAVTSVAGSITVGVDSKSESNNGSGAYVGNEGTIGDLTAYTSVSVKRNTGTVGNLTSTTASVAVGQGNATYVDYNTNFGTIGAVDAATSVAIYGTSDTGRVAAEDGQSIQAGTSVSIGGTAYFNQNTVGPVNAGTTVAVYSQVDLGVIDAAGNVTIGAVATPNEGNVGDITSTGGSVTIYGAQGVMVGDINAGTSVIIGSATGLNQATVTSVTAGTTVTIVNGENGEVGPVDAGSTVTIGSATAFNEGKIGTVEAAGGVNVYNGSAELETIHGGSSIYLYANAGTIGDVTSDTGSVSVGDSSKTDDASAAGRVGNSGVVGNLEGTSVTVYRNSGTIGNLTATTGGVTIGQSNNANENVAAYNVNTGVIGSVDAATTVAIHSGAAGSVATGEGQSVQAGSTVTIGSTGTANGNDVGAVTSGTTGTIYSGTGTVASLTAGTSLKAYISDGSKDLNLATSSGDIEIVDQTTSNGPSVNVTTTYGDVQVGREEGDPITAIHAKVNLTVTDGLAAGQTLFIRGAFASVVHKGAGDVLMESADTTVTNVVLQGSGEVKAYGSAGTVTKPEDDSVLYILSLVPVTYNTVDVYLLTTDGTGLAEGTLEMTVDGGTFAPSGVVTVIGGGASEKVGTVTVDDTTAQSVSVTVNGSYIPTGGEAIALAQAACQVTIPAAIERVDTVFLTSEDDFTAAKAQYNWSDDIAAPADYPVLAVMPVVNEAYPDAEVKVDETVVTDGVVLVAVSTEDALENGSVTVGISAAGAGVPTYSDSIEYTLTDADKAKLDTENVYYYITFRYMDGKTSDLVVPVVQGQSVQLEAATERTGYTFLGWQSGETLYTVGTSFTPEADTVLTAQWGADSATYTLTINTTGNGTVVRVIDGTEYPIASGTSFRAGEEVTLLAKRNTGSKFSFWNMGDTQSYEETLTVTMDQDKDVTASFRRISSGSSTYSISVGSVENGTVSCTSGATKGSEVAITLKPDEGYQVGSVQVVTASGESVSVKERSDGKYVFTMPGAAVRIMVAFVEDEGADLPFIDVTGHWALDAIRYVYENGMMNGATSTKFAPEAELTRGMIVTILYRLEKEPAVSDGAFADVDGDMYYADPIAWAAENDIVTGYDETTFGPENAVTREQLAAILYRYAQYKGMAAVTMEENLTGFSDADQISAYAVQPLNWAVGQELINGVDEGTLRPQGTATRAQVATILMRFCENLAE